MGRSIASMLDRVSRFARDYRGDAESAWEIVKRDHDRAMVVRAIEDLVSFGCFLLTTLAHDRKFWHGWVAEDVSRYDPETEKAFDLAEAQVIECSRTVLRLIEQGSSWGYSVDRAEEFCRVVSEFPRWTDEQGSLPLDQIKKAKRDALDEHRAGRTVEISEW